MNETHEQAATLLDIIWQGVNSDLKSRYRQTIWEQYENTIRSSAYTNNLGKFVSYLCSKMSAQIQAKHTNEAETILNSGQDRRLLKVMRDETTLIVLMVRVRNQERRERYDAEQSKRDLFDSMSPDQLFEGEDK